MGNVVKHIVHVDGRGYNTEELNKFLKEVSSYLPYRAETSKHNSNDIIFRDKDMNLVLYDSINDNHVVNGVIKWGKPDPRYYSPRFLEASVNPFDINAIIPCPMTEEEKINNNEEYNIWKQDNWGLVIEPFDISIKNEFESVVIAFSTWWNTPFNIFKILSERYNKLNFIVRYVDVDDLGNKVGLYCCENGISKELINSDSSKEDKLTVINVVCPELKDELV